MVTAISPGASTVFGIVTPGLVPGDRASSTVKLSSAPFAGGSKRLSSRIPMVVDLSARYTVPLSVKSSGAKLTFAETFSKSSPATAVPSAVVPSATTMPVVVCGAVAPSAVSAITVTVTEPSPSPTVFAAASRRNVSTASRTTTSIAAEPAVALTS